MEYSSTRPTKESSTPEINHLPEAVAALKSAGQILIITHERPDGDAVGSASGFTRSLRKAGKVVDIAISTPIPDNFQFLLEKEVILKHETLDQKYDLIFVLDTGDRPRTGFETFLAAAKVPVVNIDHHPSNTRFGKINLLDFQASSTCEIMAAFIDQAGLPLDAEVAEGLYLGLMTDTRFFQNEKIRPSAFRTAETLLNTGLDSSPILAKLTRQRKLAELKILGMGLTKLETAMGGQLATIVLSKDDFRTCDAPLETAWSSGLFGQMMALSGIVAGVCLMEGPDGKCYCEFRSTSGFDVKDVAVAMGGGGHLAASGCNRMASFPQFAKEILELVHSRLEAFLSQRP